MHGQIWIKVAYWLPVQPPTQILNRIWLSCAVTKIGFPSQTGQWKTVTNPKYPFKGLYLVDENVVDFVQ